MLVLLRGFFQLGLIHHHKGVFLLKVLVAFTETIELILFGGPLLQAFHHIAHSLRIGIHFFIIDEEVSPYFLDILVLGLLLDGFLLGQINHLQYLISIDHVSTSIESWEDVKGIADVDLFVVLPEVEDKQVSEVLG